MFIKLSLHCSQICRIVLVGRPAICMLIVRTIEWKAGSKNSHQKIITCALQVVVWVSLSSTTYLRKLIISCLVPNINIIQAMLIHTYVCIIIDWICTLDGSLTAGAEMLGIIRNFFLAGPTSERQWRLNSKIIARQGLIQNNNYWWSVARVRSSCKNDAFDSIIDCLNSLSFVSCSLVLLEVCRL